MVAWQWLPLTIRFNSYGAFENRLNFATVEKTVPESPRGSYFVSRSSNWPGNSEMTQGFIYLVSLIQSAFVIKWDLSQLCTFLDLFHNQNHCWPSYLNLWNQLKNHQPVKKKNIQWWWFSAGKTIDSNSALKKSSLYHCFEKITIVEV